MSFFSCTSSENNQTIKKLKGIDKLTSLETLFITSPGEISNFNLKIIINIDFSGCTHLKNVIIPQKMPCAKIDYYVQLSRAYLTPNGYASVGNGITMTYDGIFMDGTDLDCPKH